MGCLGVSLRFGEVDQSVLDSLDVVGEKPSRRNLWTVELVVAGILGGAIAAPILISVNAATWVTSCFGPTMTTYAAASAAFAYIAHRSEAGNPVRIAFLHFAAVSVNTVVGFFVVFTIIRLIPGH